LLSAYALVPLLTEAPAPILALLEPRLPRGDAWRYEPKLDGFRGLLWHRTTSVIQLLSRNGRDLAPWFPELIQAGQKLPAGTLIDGEIVIADDEGRVDFTALQARLSTARNQVSRIAFERAAVLVAFDALEIAGLPLVDQPLTVRRKTPRAAARNTAPLLAARRADARRGRRGRLAQAPAKYRGRGGQRGDRHYAPGRGRAWVKVKRYRTVDCIVIGVVGDADSPKLVLGLRHKDTLIHHFERPIRVICHPQSMRASTASLHGSLVRGPQGTPTAGQHSLLRAWRVSAARAA